MGHTTRLIIDGNSLGYANHNAAKLNVGELQTQAIFGVLKSIKHLQEDYPHATPLVLWDGEAKWRKEIYPDYKANRVPKNEVARLHKEAYKTQMPFIRKSLQLLGVRQIFALGAEADDLAGIFSKRYSAAGENVVVVTGDQDWLQMVNEYVTWFDPIRDNKVTLANFLDFTAYFTTEAFLDGKALMGDGSDNISPVGGIGEKGAPEFLAEFKSVDAFYQAVEEGRFVPKKKAHIMLCGTSPFTKGEWEAQFEGDRESAAALAKHMNKWPGQGRIIFERNRKLMNLLAVPNPPKDDVRIIHPTPNKEAFKMLCEKLYFASILREFDQFTSVFGLH